MVQKISQYLNSASKTLCSTNNPVFSSVNPKMWGRSIRSIKSHASIFPAIFPQSSDSCLHKHFPRFKSTTNTDGLFLDKTGEIRKRHFFPESAMPIVTLKDGTELCEATLIEIMMTLRFIEKKEFAALLDLVEKCKNSNYQRDANSAFDSNKILRIFNLIDSNERVHDVVKSVVLNAVEGKGNLLKLVEPKINLKTGVLGLSN